MRVRIEEGPGAKASALIFQGRPTGGNRSHRGYLYLPPNTRPYAFDEQDGFMLPAPLCWGDLFLLPHPDDFTPRIPNGITQTIGGEICIPLELVRVGTAALERVLWMTERGLGGARQWLEVQIDEYRNGSNAITRTIDHIDWQFVDPDMRLAIGWTARDASGSGAACAVELANVDLNPPSDDVFESRSLPRPF